MRGDPRRGTYIGTDTPDGDQEEDGTDGKEPVKVVIDSHVGTLDNNVESRLWIDVGRSTGKRMLPGKTSFIHSRGNIIL
jgi:hypothetical protein